MPFLQSAGTEYFSFDRLREAGLVHGIFTRRGGVSPEPWGSLNAGSLVGDAEVRVLENLSRACRALDRTPETLRLVRQVHGGEVHIARRAAGPAANGMLAERLRLADLPEADALVTASDDLTLAMRFADCVPILFYDPEKRATGIAHAGWRGPLLDVAGRTVAAMRREFGTEPADLMAGIGPSICAEHYEVGPEVAEEAAKAFAADEAKVIRTEDGRRYFDLWAANRLLLEKAGVGAVEIAGECTVEDPERWFSHRGEGGRTGRFAVVAGIAVG
jgi:YfiH family protein